MPIAIFVLLKNADNQLYNFFLVDENILLISTFLLGKENDWFIQSAVK